MIDHRTKPVFLVFEGLDGAGKTTCAKRTAEMLGAQYMTTPTEELRVHRDKIIASLGGSQEAAQLFYLATVLAASEGVKGCLAAGQSVVLDRYFLSTQVYAEFRGSRLDVEDRVSNRLLPPDLTVFLDAPVEVRRRRAIARGCTAADSETVTDRAHAELCQGYERRANLPVVGEWLRIDSSIAGMDEIARKIVAHLAQQKAVQL